MSDPFDLGFEGEHVYETETWRPSADYPDVTRVALRREGRVLVRRTVEAHGPPDEARFVIERVHRAIGRATLRREGAEHTEQLDIVTRSFTTSGEFIVPMKTTRSAIDRGAWVIMLSEVARAASRVHETIAARRFEARDLDGVDWPEEPGSCTRRWEARTDVAPEDTSWMAAQFGVTHVEPPPPGVGLTLRVSTGSRAVDAWAAEGTLPLLMVGLFERDGTCAALVRGMLRPGTLEAVDAAVEALVSTLGFTPS